MGIIICFRTHSGGSVPFPKAMRSVVMPACLMGWSAFGWQDDGKGPVWNVPGNKNPALLMGMYLCCALWKSLTVKEGPSSGRLLSCLSLGRC